MSLKRKYHNVSGRAATAARRRRLQKRSQRSPDYKLLLRDLREGKIVFAKFPGEIQAINGFKNHERRLAARRAATVTLIAAE